MSLTSRASATVKSRLRRVARLGRPLAVATVAAAVTASMASTAGAAAAQEADPAFKALVFSKTTGFRHDSIPDGIAAIQKLGQEHNFSVDTTEDSSVFTDDNLAQYNVVIFVSTTGDPLGTQDEKDAFQRYIEHGGGFAGVHAAADSGYDWEWYGGLVGAYFKQHPAIQQATVKVEDPAHPSTKGLPSTWSRTDEWYDYQTDPRGTVHVLTSLDEKSYTGGTMGYDHPNTWCQDYDGGRSWYTGLGHTKESYTEPNFLNLLLGGIQTAAGAVPADCSASQDTSFEKVTLDDNTSNPMMLDVAQDGRVFYIDRLGDVKVVQTNGSVATAAHLDVFTANESGLLGMALDPDFATNNWMYLYYSPNGSESVDQLSRFTVKADSTLDLASEKVVLKVPVQRTNCCHHGGGMVFDKETGDLWLANGDNTNPFNSDGYAPIDERPEWSDWDAQKSAANTNDLRGKLLRIHPEQDGTYTIPEGNLFPPGTEKTRPEIYAMGFRNPFRIGIDPLTHKVMVGNYGPDAQSANADRGPENTVEWDIMNQPGFYGWPYCIGQNVPYNDYDFATGVSGPKFDCANPVNDSPNNTGLTNLPPAIPATVDYHYAANPEFPEIGGGGAPMAGPVYRYDPDLTSDRKWPAYWDGKAIFGEWNQNNLFSFQLNEDGSKLVDINRMFPTMSFLKPMDMKFGPDGALYLIEWGSGFGGDNADSGVYRIDYVQGNRAPIARAQADKQSGVAPLTVNFTSNGSLDPDGTPVTYAWDFQSDGTVDSTEANPTYTYTANGNFSATLTVTDADGRTGTANVPITVGNTAPTVTLNIPPNGGFFDWGDQVKYSITVTDPEDGTIDCDDVQLQSVLGHDTHGHPLDQYTGCDGTVQTTLSSGHSEGDNVFAVLEASYTDKGGAGGSSPLTGRAQAILQPKHKQAEFFTATGRVADGAGTGDPGVTVETASDTAGGFKDIGFIEDGDWWSFDPVNLTDIDSIGFRVASLGGNGVIEVHHGATDGTLLGKIDVPATGDWQSYTDITLPLDNPPTDTAPLYFVARRPDGSTNTGGMFNVNWIDFNGKGVTDNQRPAVTATATPDRGTAPLTVNFHADATDPDGDNPLTYQWDFGVAGAPGATTPDASYTYTAPGNYDASVTVTDSRGAATTEHVPVVVDSPSVTCLTGRSDDFLGTALDDERWEVVRQNQDLTVHDGALHIPTTNTDIYGTDNSNATPNLVLQPMPDGAWQATTKVSLTARDAYQQAGLILYGDDDNYAKMVLEGRGTASAADRIFQFIREENGTPNEVADSNTANLGADYPDTAYVRLSSDGTHLTASYSADGLSWTNMPETDKLIAGIANPRIGLVSLSGTGTRPVIDAAFDWFQLVPDDTQTAPSPNDEFDGSGVDGCRWTTVVRPDASKTRVTGGNLEIDTTPGDIYGTDNSGPANFTLQTPPAGDWTVETKVDGSAFNEAYHQGGLIVYTDDANYVKLDYIADSATAKRIEFRSEIGDVVQDPQPTVNNLTQGVWYLRLTKSGDTYRGSYSADGQTWTDLGDTLTNAAVSSGKVGLFAFGVNATQSVTAKFDYFHASWADEAAPVTTATTDPAAGANGWFTGPVSVSLSATDEGTGVDRTEYTVDGGAWTPYTEPFTVSGDKAHQVQYRSVDKNGNVEEAKSLAVSIDATAPLTTAQFAPGNDGGWHTGAIPVTLSATDETSGVASTEYSLDGGPWTPYTEAVDVTGDGTHTVTYRSTDNAGNVETQKAATVKIDGTRPTVLISGISDRQVYGDSQDLRISWQAVDSTSGVRTLEGTLDGDGFATGSLLPLYTTSLGTHTLTVTAVDNAGNRTDQTVTFGVSTSTRDIANLVDRFKAVGWINQATQKQLQDQLTKARKAEANGNDGRAVKQLDKFRTLVLDIGNAEVRDALLRDTDDVIARLS